MPDQSGAEQPRPFTDALRQIYRRGCTYEQLAERSQRARSTSWFYSLMTHRSPWVVCPPDPYAFTGLAQLLERSIPEIRAMIALEWYGIDATSPGPLLHLAPLLSTLDDEDIALLTLMADRMTRGATGRQPAGGPLSAA